MASTPGLDSRGNIGPYLDGSMPTLDVQGAGIPATLSQTAAFSYTNTPAMTPHPGLVPYTINSMLWSDGSAKQRWLALPYDSGSASNPKIDNHPTGIWKFPNGTAIVKHFGMVVNESNGDTRRLETRILIRDANGGVYGRSYRWRADNLDADIVNTNGGELDTITITGPDGTTTRTQEWRYPGPDQCLQCHKASTNDPNGLDMALGLKTRQLNGDYGYPTGRTDNQLHTLLHLDMLANAIPDQTSYPQFEKLAPLSDTTATYEHRLRSYVDANCAFCHQPGGPGPRWDARYTTPYAQQNIAGDAVTNAFAVLHRFSQDTSVMYFRDSIDPRATPFLRSIMMPPVARNIPHTEWLTLLQQYINYPYDTTQALAVGDPTKIKLKFDRAVDPVTAAIAANYAVNNGITVSAAEVDSLDPAQVILTVSSMTPNTAYRVSVSNVLESGSISANGVKNPIWPNTWETFTYLTAPSPQVIAFATLPDKFKGDAPFSVSANGGTSGNPVVFTSLTAAICTVSGTNGTTVSLTGTPGLCTLAANQAGSATHQAAATVTQSFKVLWRVSIVLEGSQSIPAVVSPAAGGGTVIYDATNRSLWVSLTYTGLEGQETMAHIHGPAGRGANAGILIDLDMGSPKVQSVTLDATQEGYLLAGQLYINVHTTAQPGGEVRGQLDALGSAGVALRVDFEGDDANATRTQPGNVVLCAAPCPGNPMVLPLGTAVSLTAAGGYGTGEYPSGVWSGCDSQTFGGVNFPLVRDATCSLTLNSSRAIKVSFAPEGTPSAPLNVAAAAGDGQSLVSFSPPASTRGGTITGYSVVCTAGMSTVTQGGFQSPIAVPLVNGTTYSCNVRALTATATGATSTSVTVTPFLPPALLSIKSRKAHRNTGDIDLDVTPGLGIGGAITVEPRGGPHKLIFTFNVPVTSIGNIVVTDKDGASAVRANRTLAGNTIELPLDDIADNTRVGIVLNGVNGNLTVQAAVGFLQGDVNSSKSVNATDIMTIKRRFSATVDVSNARFDLNLDGQITTADLGFVKNRAGRMIP